MKPILPVREVLRSALLAVVALALLGGCGPQAAEPAPEPEIGWFEVELTPEGREDPDVGAALMELFRDEGMKELLSLPPFQSHSFHRSQEGIRIRQSKKENDRARKETVQSSSSKEASFARFEIST